MSGFEFTLTNEKIPRKERDKKEIVRAGDAGPYGRVVLTVGRFPRMATLTCAALPPASLTHPDQYEQGEIPIDETATLTVDGVNATLQQNRWGLTKEKRALHIDLDGRKYTYLSVGIYTEELRDAAGEPLVHIRRPGFGPINVLPRADEIALAVALIFQVADTARLTQVGYMIRTPLEKLFNNGMGNA